MLTFEGRQAYPMRQQVPIESINHRSLLHHRLGSQAAFHFDACLLMPVGIINGRVAYLIHVIYRLSRNWKNDSAMYSNGRLRLRSTKKMGSRLEQMVQSL